MGVAWDWQGHNRKKNIYKRATSFYNVDQILFIVFFFFLLFSIFNFFKKTRGLENSWPLTHKLNPYTTWATSSMFLFSSYIVVVGANEAHNSTIEPKAMKWASRLIQALHD